MYSPNVRAHRLERRADSSTLLIDQRMRQVQRIDGGIASSRGLRDGSGNRLLTTAGGELRSVQVHLEGTKSCADSTEALKIPLPPT